jgi:hypothetical protein
MRVLTWGLAFAVFFCGLYWLTKRESDAGFAELCFVYIILYVLIWIVVGLTWLMRLVWSARLGAWLVIGKISRNIQKISPFRRGPSGSAKYDRWLQPGVENRGNTERNDVDYLQQQLDSCRNKPILGEEDYRLFQRVIKKHVDNKQSVFADRRLLRCIVTFAGIQPDFQGLKDLFNAVPAASLLLHPPDFQSARIAALGLIIAPTEAVTIQLEAVARQLLLLFQVKKGKNQENIRASVLDLEEAMAAVFSALGACEACRGRFTDFAADEELALKHDGLVQERRQVVSGSAMPDAELALLLQVAERLQNVDMTEFKQRVFPRLAGVAMSDEKKKTLLEQVAKIVSCDTQIKAIEERFSSAFRLRLVLSQAQDYPVNVRQGAAMGLQHILRSPSITQDARSQIEKCLRDCIDAPEAVDFRTYHVRLLPDSSPGEVAFELRRGLLWMVKETTALAPYAGLYQTVSEISRCLPDAVSFLENYPLRLMSPQDHQGVLGNYISRGFDHGLWTRFTPPKDIGQVHARWLEVTDRTTPNSMGISYALFQHTCLVLPVIYHEYLHYRGERNEAKVWLRESLFRKGMIAGLAPSDDSAVNAYETEIRRLSGELGPTESLSLLQCHAYDNDFLSYLNELITSLYGLQLTEAQADVQAGKVVDAINDDLQLENASIKWCPEIKWPLLGSPEGLAQRNEIFQIVKRQKLQCNTIAKGEMDAIIAEPGSAYMLSSWHRYMQRPSAGRTLFAPMPESAYSLQALVDAARAGN